MHKMLLRLLIILFPCTALGITKYSFDINETEKSSFLCVIAKHDDGTEKTITSNISCKDIEKAFVLLECVIHKENGKDIYKFYYKLLVVGSDDQAYNYMYRFNWPSIISSSDGMKDIIIRMENIIVPLKFNVLEVNESQIYMETFCRCPNFKSKKNIQLLKRSKCLTLLYEKHNPYREKYKVLEDNLLIIDYII